MRPTLEHTRETEKPSRDSEIERLSSSRSFSRSKLKGTKSFDKSTELENKLKFINFLGLSLSGSKSSRTCLTVLEYYPNQKKVFLKEIHDKIKESEEISSDAALFELIQKYIKSVPYLAVDAPVQLPKCMRCKLKCPGVESCDEPEIKWLKRNVLNKGKNKSNPLMITPYTERCVEAYVSSQLEENFHPSHAMGANAAPVLARAHFLKRRLNMEFLEVFPRVSMWRIGLSLGVQKSYLRNYKHSLDGEEIRAAILKRMIDRDLIFIYSQDVKTLVHNPSAFDAFICVLTAVLNHQNQTERRPKGFPKGETWAAIPKKNMILW